MQLFTRSKHSFIMQCLDILKLLCGLFTKTFMNSSLMTGCELLLFRRNNILNKRKTHRDGTLKIIFLKGIIPIQYWASTYQSIGLMNRPTAWPSFAEYGAFERRTYWMAYIAVFVSLFAYKAVYLFPCGSLSVL